MIRDIVQGLKDTGIYFVSYLPESWLHDVYDALLEDPHFEVVLGANEGECVGIVSGAWLGGRYVPSLLAAIGGVIERHLQQQAPPATDEIAPALPSRPFTGAACPRCGGFDLVRKEGCDTCFGCGYSQCG